MALILLAFIGTLAIFFRIWRELDGVRRSIGEIRESLQYYAVEAGQQNRDLANLVRELRSLTGTAEREAPGSGDDSLGELLEKGLPNLMDASASAGGNCINRPLPPLHDREEEDFLRRFETGPGKGASS